jgi:hypothetical protein
MKYIITPILVCIILLAGCDFPLPFTTPASSSNPPQTSDVPPSSPPGTTVSPTTVTTAATSSPGTIVVEKDQSDILVTRTYKWSYNGQDWTWELQIPDQLYEYYKGLPRAPTSNYSIYVTHPSDDLYISKLNTKLLEAVAQKGYSDIETVSFAASFVQSLPYVTDIISTGYDEYARFPMETLVDSGGDCEDTSILLASLLNGMGYNVVLINPPEHVAVGVAGVEGAYGTYWEYQGEKYYYLETTGENWQLGEIPDQYQNVQAKIYSLQPVPILTHDWTSTGRVGYADLNIVVKNLGSAAAQDVYVFAGFDAGNDQVWNSTKSDLFNIDIEQTVTVNLSLKVPYGVNTRIVVQIIYNGYAVDNSYSDWISTN